MRVPLTLIVFFLFNTSATLQAQNWKWGRGNTGTGLDGWAVATDPSGNVFAAGINFGIYPAVIGPYTLPDVGPGAYQCIIIKYDANGNVLWANGTQNGNSCLINIAADQNGNSVLFGSFQSATIQIGSHILTNTVFPNTQYFLVKYDPFGNVLWAVNSGNCQFNYATLGNIAVVLGCGGIATDAAGNIYITASFHMPSITIGTSTLINADPSGLTNDILLVKYDPTGNVVWAKSVGGPGSDEAYGITVTPAGDIYIAGVFGSASLTFGASVISNASSGQVAFIARYDASGTPVWASGSGGNGHEYAVGLVSDLSNNVYLTGGLRDNSISFSGTVISNPDTVPVLYLAKFDPANNVIWSKTIGPAIDTGRGAWGYSIAISQCGTVWVSGCMNGAVNIDGNILSVPPNSSDPIFMAGFSPSGTYEGSTALQSGGDDQNGIACDGFGNVFMCSDYETYPFSIGTDTFPAPATISGELLFVARYATQYSLFNNATGKDTSICMGSQVLLNAPAGFANYIWNDGGTGATKNVSDTGIFWVTGFDSCTNAVADTFRITGGNRTVTCTKTDICLGGPVSLKAHTGFSNYIWNDGTIAFSRTVSDTGTYWVKGFDTCSGSAVDTFRITAGCDCINSVFVPNAFTPNGDGQDDVFYPRCGASVKKIKTFNIYNRWGELLFAREDLDPNDERNSWDGTFNGNQPLPDVYVWVVEAVCTNGNHINKKGSITVIR